MLLIAGLSGCTANHYRKAADAESYKAIRQKAGQVPNMDRNFTIEQTNQMEFSHLPLAAAPPEFLDADAQREEGARVLSLEEALRTAIHHNRSYQSRKEQLYLTALAVTLVRHNFTPLFSGGGKAAVSDATTIAERVDTVVEPGINRTRDILHEEVIEDPHVKLTGDFTASWLIRDLGKITATFATDFTRFFTGGPHTVASSRALATFTRPLLRDAGYKRELELLTQAERDLLYDLRAFAHYRKTFSVQVASAYYAVLGSRDAVRNNYLNLLSSRKNAERTRELAREGRVTQSDLGRLEQQVLATESTWNTALRSYQQSLDDFKLAQLGLPVNTKLILDDRELTALTIKHPNLNAEDAVQLGLIMRLDYLNVLDRHEDTVRRIGLAKDAFKPQANLVAELGLNSGDRVRGFGVPDWDRRTWSAGLELDLPFDRKLEANIYRAALITERQAARTVEQQADQIRLDLRESWRNLDRAKRNYEISELGVELSERRVEEQQLLAELGRAKAQDQVDAQNDLISAKNQRTQALVSHTIARLQFWTNMGLLYIRDDGQWREMKDSDVSKSH